MIFPVFCPQQAQGHIPFLQILVDLLPVGQHALPDCLKPSPETTAGRDCLHPTLQAAAISALLLRRVLGIR